MDQEMQPSINNYSSILDRCCVSKQHISFRKHERDHELTPSLKIHNYRWQRICLRGGDYSQCNISMRKKVQQITHNLSQFHVHVIEKMFTISKEDEGYDTAPQWIAADHKEKSKMGYPISYTYMDNIVDRWEFTMCVVVLKELCIYHKLCEFSLIDLWEFIKFN